MCTQEKNTINVLKNMIAKYGVPYDKEMYIDDELNRAFNNIAGHNKFIFCFDIEFHNMVTNNNRYILTKNKTMSVAHFVRELGIIVFVKESDKWKYLGYIFKNVQNKIDNNTILILSKYATVTETNKKIMELNEKYFNTYDNIKDTTIDTLTKDTFNELNTKLKSKYIKQVFHKNDYNCIIKNLKLLKQIVLSKKLDYDELSINKLTDDKLTDNKLTDNKLKDDLKYVIRKLSILRDAPFRIYPKILDKDSYRIYDRQMDCYYKDAYVQKRTFTSAELKNFFSMLVQVSQEMCYLVKGDKDFTAIKNTMIDALGHNSIIFSKVYDIEIFNWLSYTKYGSAQLENTYNGIISSKFLTQNINTTLDTILNHIHFKSAHNPVTDSYYTLVVALFINLCLNKCF